MVKRILVVLCIVGVSATALGQGVQIFDDRDMFRDFNRSQGKVSKGLEDFEEHNLGPGAVGFQRNPLDQNPNVNYPNGLTGLLNLSVSSSGGSDIILFTTGFFGNASSIVGASQTPEFTSLTFDADDKTGVGFDVGNFLGDQDGEIRTYDTAGNLIDARLWPMQAPQMTFFGIWAPGPIGRIEIEGTAGAGELLDNVEAWVPEPSSLSLLALGGLALLRRRS